MNRDIQLRDTMHGRVDIQIIIDNNKIFEIPAVTLDTGRVALLNDIISGNCPSFGSIKLGTGGYKRDGLSYQTEQMYPQVTAADGAIEKVSMDSFDVTVTSESFDKLKVSCSMLVLAPKNNLSELYLYLKNGRPFAKALLEKINEPLNVTNSLEIEWTVRLT